MICDNTFFYEWTIENILDAGNQTPHANSGKWSLRNVWNKKKKRVVAFGSVINHFNYD